MIQNSGKKIGAIRLSKYLVKIDKGLLRLNDAKVRMCSVLDDEAKSRGCTELHECEELVLVYRPFGCIKEKNGVDLSEAVDFNSSSMVS